MPVIPTHGHKGNVGPETNPSGLQSFVRGEWTLEYPHEVLTTLAEWTWFLIENLL